MTIDELGRAAATEARRNAAASVDTVTMLKRLHRLRRRRTAGAILSTLVIAAAVVAGGILITHDDQGERHHAPVTNPTPSRTGLCADRNVRCLGTNQFRVANLPVPITLTLPTNFQRTISVEADAITVYRSDISTTGVSVIEKASPAKYGPRSWSRDPAAGNTAASVARWLSERPFLIHTTRTRTTVGGLPGWHVSGDLKPGAPLPAPKEGGDVAPTFGRSYNGSSGYSANLTGQYTLLDVPGAGVTVIWSWTYKHGNPALAGNKTFIDGVSFG